MNKNKSYRITIVCLLFYLVCFFPSLHGQYSDYGIIPQKTYSWFGNIPGDTLIVQANPLKQVPPVCGKKKRAHGHILPLPFGTGISYNYTKQFYNASDLQLTNDSIGFVARGKANLQQSRVEEVSMAFRPDVWIFPFMNIYGLVGYSRVKTIPIFNVPRITISNIPNIGDIVIDTTIKIEDEILVMAPVYGGGVSISTGYKSFFVLADYHFRLTVPPGQGEFPETHTFSVKAGLLAGHNVKKLKGSVWLGATYIDDSRVFRGEIEVKEILPVLEILFGEKATYSGKLTPQQAWNLVAGFSISYLGHHLIAIEAGYFKRQQLSVFYGFRF